MNCPRCGEVCSCHSEPLPVELAQWTPEKGDPTAIVSPIPANAPEAELPASEGRVGEEGEQTEGDAWREELAVRLSRYRSRRKVRPPRYPSLRLHFDPPTSLASTDNVSSNSYTEFETMSDRALALDQTIAKPRTGAVQQPGPTLGTNPVIPEALAGVNSGAKIIEFPRFAWGPPPPPPDQLAEPVADRPRILDVPETAPPPPALGGITIEPSHVQEIEKRPGIDFPLQSASFLRRILAGVIDGLVVSAAAALFAFIFWKVAGIAPPRVQIVGLAGGVLSLSWALYEYLLIVYSGCTPGLYAARLELMCFDGKSTTRSLRRWRVLSSYLSAASLGMGYAWVFLDEDSLCWHDRITHTYLAPRTDATKNT